MSISFQHTHFSARELLFRCHGNEKLWVNGMMNLRCLKTFNQSWLSWRVIVLIAGGTRGGSDLRLFLRPFSGLNLMSLKQMASFFGFSLARSSEGLSSCWRCWSCLWECSWSDTGLVRVHGEQRCAHSKDNWAEGQREVSGLYWHRAGA